MREFYAVVITCVLYAPLLGASEISNNLHEFAQDGLNVGKPIMNKSTETILNKFGLPDKIIIRKEEAYWDVDIEQTPADWVYPGLLISTYYYRNGMVKEGIGHLVPGPYYDSKTLSGITVTKDNIPVRFNLAVGSKKSSVIQKLGKPGETKENVITYVSNTHEDMGRDIIVSFQFNKEMIVKEIKWSLTSWH